METWEENLVYIFEYSWSTAKWATRREVRFKTVHMEKTRGPSCFSNLNQLSFTCQLGIMHNFHAAHIICENVTFSINYLFELLKFKEFHEKENIKNWWKPRRFFLQSSPPLQCKFPRIDNISLSYRLVEYYVSPFFY